MNLPRWRPRCTGHHHRKPSVWKPLPRRVVPHLGRESLSLQCEGLMVKALTKSARHGLKSADDFLRKRTNGEAGIDQALPGGTGRVARRDTELRETPSVGGRGRLHRGTRYQEWSWRPRMCIPCGGLTRRASDSPADLDILDGGYETLLPTGRASSINRSAEKCFA